MCPNSAPHTAQLQSLNVLVFAIAYRRWNFRVMDFAREFPKSKPLERFIYAKHPSFAVWNTDNRWKLVKPLSGLPTACSEWYHTPKDFLFGYLWGPRLRPIRLFSSGRKRISFLTPCKVYGRNGSGITKMGFAMRAGVFNRWGRAMMSGYRFRMYAIL